MARQKDKREDGDAARKVGTADLTDQNLKKHIAAIHISNRLTLTQRKASNVLLYNAYDSLLTARVHSIRVKDLAEAIGFVAVATMIGGMASLFTVRSLNDGWAAARRVRGDA